MKGRLMGLVAVTFLVSSSLFISFTSIADIAPVRFVDGGNLAVFVEAPEIAMDSYSVAVDVNLPWVNETLSYCLRNPTGNEVNITVMVPMFQYFSSEYGGTHLEPADGTVELIVDGTPQAYQPEDLVTADFSDIRFEGVYAPVCLPADSYTNITLTCSKLAVDWTGQPVEEFSYFYSAETAAFWNGTVRHGTFNLSYHGNWESTNFTAPGAVNNGPEVHSEVWDIDVRNVDANYSVNIITGDITPPYVRPGSDGWILPLGIVIAAIAAVITAGLILRKRAR